MKRKREREKEWEWERERERLCMKPSLNDMKFNVTWCLNINSHFEHQSPNKEQKSKSFRVNSFANLCTWSLHELTGIMRTSWRQNQC